MARTKQTRRLKGKSVGKKAVKDPAPEEPEIDEDISEHSSDTENEALKSSFESVEDEAKQFSDISTKGVYQKSFKF